MISKTAEYGLRAMVVLQRHKEDGPVLGRDIAREGFVPEPYIGTIMNRLRTAGLVSGERGPGGGYYIRSGRHDISVGQIVSVFDDVDAQRRCVLGHPTCDITADCPVHDMWADVLKAYDRFLCEMTLDRLADIQSVTHTAKRPRSKRTK